MLSGSSYSQAQNPKQHVSAARVVLLLFYVVRWLYINFHAPQINSDADMSLLKWTNTSLLVSASRSKWVS